MAECLKQHFGGENPPERKNLEFLLGLRNKIEHRDLPTLDAGLYGECQAALLNLEEYLVKEFSDRFALAEQLAVSLQFSHIIPAEKKKAAKRLATKEAKSVRDYVEKFRGALPSSTLNTTKYSFNVFLVPKVANRKELADFAVEFIPIEAALDSILDDLEMHEVSRRVKAGIGGRTFRLKDPVAEARKQVEEFTAALLGELSGERLTSLETNAKAAVKKVKADTRRRELFDGKRVLDEFYRRHIHSTGMSKEIFVYECARQASKRQSVAEFVGTLFATLAIKDRAEAATT